MELIRKDIAAICMHTNLDAANGGVNDVLAERLMLEDVDLLGDEHSIGRVGTLAEEMPLSSFLPLVRKRLRTNGLRFAQSGKSVKKVAVAGGSCGDYFPIAAAKGCDTFITADVKYNQFMDAVDLGVTIIDAGHFPTEDPLCYTIMDKLGERFPELSVMKSYTHREIVQYYM